MANKPVQPDPEETHNDLLATLAASRELGPEMDKALAESYIQRHPELAGKQSQQQQAVVAQPDAQRPVSADMIGIAGMGIGVVAYVAVLAFSRGQLWWMFWPLMGWFGWRWGHWGYWGHRGQGGYRDEMRQARYQARAEYYRARAARYASYYGGAPQPQVPQPQPQPPVPVAPPVQQSALESRPSDVPPSNLAG